MASSYELRSNSFPSRSTPRVSQLDEQLNRIKSSELASSSSSTITSKLTLLSNLYDNIDELLQLPSSQKSLFQQGAEVALEQSIKLLDTCTTISDVLVQMKERAQELQSILRRRCSKDDVANEVAKYLKSRKSSIKVVTRALKDLKEIDNKESLECNQVVSRLRDCQMVTLNVLESALVAIAGTKARNGWETVVSKMMKSKHVQETKSFLVELEASDVALHSEKVRSGLEKMEAYIKDVEEGAEILFRHLIKTRTTILNILNC